MTNPTDPTVPAAPPAILPEQLAEMAALGVVRIPADVFHVGGYRYTNLADALAEARRQAARPAS